MAAYTLPSRKSATVPLPLAAAVAALRYREELKMYAALADDDAQRRGRKDAPASMDDPTFLDAQHARILGEWPQSVLR